jgi:hypothetical protein
MWWIRLLQQLRWVRLPRLQWLRRLQLPEV